jgi:hypothetical protein
MVIWSLDAFVVRTAGDPAAPAPSARAAMASNRTSPCGCSPTYPTRP